MTRPLAQPPWGPPAPRASEAGARTPIDDDGERGPAPAVTRSGTSQLVGLVEEVHSYVRNAEARRLGWALTRFIPAFALPRARARLLAMVGCDVRAGTAVAGFVHIIGPRGCASRLRVGPGCIVGPDVTFCLDAPVTLGSNVSIGPRAVLYTATHALGGESRRMQFNVMARPIVVEDGAWIGLGAIVLAGVRIGRGAVVAAGAVVGEDVPDNALVRGNPAVLAEFLPASR